LEDKEVSNILKNKFKIVYDTKVYIVYQKNTI